MDPYKFYWDRDREICPNLDQDFDPSLFTWLQYQNYVSQWGLFLLRGSRSITGIRIRTHKVAQYGSNLDPDPQHCVKHKKQRKFDHHLRIIFFAGCVDQEVKHQPLIPHIHTLAQQNNNKKNNNADPGGLTKCVSETQGESP